MVEAEAREVAFDCRLFLGDRPCAPHKARGKLCRCDEYERVGDRLLIIKLDAMGDVLRSTALLPALAEAHPASSVTWVTRRESIPLLRGNPYVSEVLEYGHDALLYLSARHFDRVINLDAGRSSAALATLATGARKDGFVLDPDGSVRPTNVPARRWLAMGLFDDAKRAGDRTYQSLMADILGLTWTRHPYVLVLADDELTEGRRHLVELGVDDARPVIGLNTGAGGRWPLKQWREDGYVALIERLGAETDAQFVLLGGPAERVRHQRLADACRIRLIDSGCDNTVRHFAAIVSQCDVIVTGDTLAMHLALARRRRTVVLFGPTSAAEIDLYDLGEKIVPEIGCLGCYKTSCAFAPNCMDLISVDMVTDAVVRQLAAARRAG